VIAGAAWTVAAPFFAGSPATAEESPVSFPDGAWQKRKDEALAALRDAEFDHQLGKLSDADYGETRSRLERQAVEAMHALEAAKLKR
jgi:hypothetical protein